MKRKLRTAYWWPGMDSNVEKTVKSCRPCVNSEKSHPKSQTPPQMIPRPKQPCQKLAIDIAGPYFTAPQESKYAVVLIDNHDMHSSFWKVLWTEEVTTDTLTKWLSEVFSRFGNPSQLVSDNGPQFTNTTFTNFLANRGIRHLHTPKRATQTFAQTRHWLEQSHEFLVVFRATPLSTGLSPSELMFGRRKNRLPYEYHRSEPTRTEESSAESASSRGTGQTERTIQ